MIWMLACSEPPAPPPLVEEAAAAEIAEAPPVQLPDPFEVYFDPRAVSGFSDPADGLAMAAGRVSAVSDDSVTVEHVFYENHERVVLSASYTGIVPTLAVDAAVSAGDRLGTGATVTLAASSSEVLHLDSVKRFVRAHREVLVPAAEERLALVSHDLYAMRFYEKGVQKGEYAVSFGQEIGRKERRGDNKSPKGAYFAVQRSRGPFEGEVGPYYGDIWVRIDYPNPWDAARGLREGLITADDAAAIDKGWRARGQTPKDTRLGGGIGFHAWAYEWEDDGPRHLSWGCIVVHVADRDVIYDFLSEGTAVVLF
jgi:hypothetical protein